MTRTIKRQLVGSCLTMAVLGLPSSGHAAPVFSNFGAGLSYETSLGNSVGDDGFGDLLVEAASFEPLSTAATSSVQVALSAVQSASNLAPVTVSLRSNASGLPNAVLESWSIGIGSLGSFGVYNAPLILPSIANPMLTAGTLYWLVVSSQANDLIAWNLNNTGDTHHTASSIDGGASFFSSSATDLTPGAFQINSVPEPGTTAVLALGLLGGAVRRYRSRKRSFAKY